VFVWGDPNEYRAVVMKIRIFLAASILLVSGQVGASIISISASAEMTGGSSLATNLFPIGTKVVADLSFDVGLGNRSTASITDVSGSFSWMDSIFGLQSYDAKNAYIRSVSSSGWFDVLFWASDRQTVGDITANAFGIKFINGVDTFRPPGSTVELYDLFLGSSIERMDVIVQQPGFPIGFGDFATNVSGNISAVPVPTTIWLFGTGLLGLIGFSKRRKAA
jgi:hypothetical protein